MVDYLPQVATTIMSTTGKAVAMYYVFPQASPSST